MFASTYLTAAVSLLLTSSSIVAAAPEGLLETRGVQVTIGCFASIPGFTYNSEDSFQTSGSCSAKCKALNMPVEAINGTDCWCGNALPSRSALVADNDCTTQCPGYGQVNCGTTGGPISFWTIWTTGINTTAIPFSGDESSVSSSLASSATPTTTLAPSVIVVGGTETVVVTATGQPANQAVNTAPAATTVAAAAAGPNTAGIAAGVVVGIILIAAIAGGVFFYMRRQSRRAVEEEYKRQAAISAMSAAGKPGSAGSFGTDTRLDPVMAQRRMSDGSIADNQDYSRRILKVTNA